MIKRNPKQLSPTTAKIKKVKEKLADVGIKFYNNKDWDNFQVYPMDDRRGEGSTYDTIGNSDEDLQDALNTGLDMAKRLGKGAPNFKKVNPKKCRVIKVRRKISMGKGKRPRILQVRRKVCNPIKTPKILKQLENLENKKVKLYSRIPKEDGQYLLSGDLYLKDFDSGYINGYHFYFDEIAKIDGNKIYLGR